MLRALGIFRIPTALAQALNVGYPSYESDGATLAWRWPQDAWHFQGYEDINCISLELPFQLVTVSLLWPGFLGFD